MKAVTGKRKSAVLSILLSALFLTSCDAVTRHEVLSTIFDGVPTLPPPEEICRGYDSAKVTVNPSSTGLQDVKEKSKQESEHPPYKEKKCSSCHSTYKDLNDGLIQPKDKLCSVCHAGFITGKLVHGPAAVGNCLACHVPHSSSSRHLLAVEGDTLCTRCHQEKRIAASMHDRLKERGMSCPDCHDPHSGNARYFLK